MRRQTTLTVRQVAGRFGTRSWNGINNKLYVLTETAHLARK